MKEVHFSDRDVAVDWDGNTLALEAGGFRRVMDFPHGAPRTVSLRGPDAVERVVPGDGPDFSLGGMIPAGPGEEWELTGIRVRRRRRDELYPAHVELEISMTDPVRRADYRRVFRLFPGLPAFFVTNSIRSEVTPALYQSPRMAGENGGAQWFESRVDSLVLNAPAHRGAAVFFGRTDYTELRVEETTCPETGCCRGNLLFVDFADGPGIGFVQEAPPSGERRDFEEHDFRLDGAAVHSCNWGLEPSAFRPGRWLRGYTHVLFFHRGKAERELTVKRIRRRALPFDARGKCTIMVNPWGCGRFPSLASAEFLQAELAAAGEIGATHYQIDDGWQTGAGLPELTRRNRCLSPEFWTISRERFGGSFRAAAAAAKRGGVELGLWLAPSCNREYRDWRDTLDTVMTMYDRYGIRRFKIDGVKLRTYEAEENLRRLFAAARKRSGGEIVFNLDVTNGQRVGYWMFGEFGNIFMENRYLNYGGVVAYHPERLLKKLWRLGKFLPLGALQIEVPNPEDASGAWLEENRDALRYPPEYWAMLAFPGEMLLWFAPSTLSAELRKRFGAVLKVYRDFRARLPEAEVFPIGNEPDGRTLSGFQFHDCSAGRGAFLWFREAGCRNGETEFVPPFSPREGKFSALSGAGAVAAAADGAFRASVADAPGYVLIEYR